MLRRLGEALATLLGVLLLVFALLVVSPGDPARLALRGASGKAVAVSTEALSAFRATYGLDRPIPERFLLWTSNAIRLDFGRSFQDGREVRVRVAETLPVTLLLNALALLLALSLSVPIAMLAAARPGGRLDRASGAVFDVIYATPAFVLGLALLLLFSVKLRWTSLFADPEEGLRGIALPVLTLALAAMAPLTRTFRSLFLAALSSPADLAGRLRGENRAERYRRAMRRSGASLTAVLATLVPTLVAGSVLVERLFSLRGAGELLAEAVFARDVPTVLALTIISAVAVVATSLVADLVAAALDPRHVIPMGAEAAP